MARGVTRADDGLLDADHIEAIDRTLRVVREHLDLEVAFVSEFVEDERVFRCVNEGAGVSCLEVGDSDPLEESYCHYVASGQLPEFLSDPSEHPVAAALDVTEALPVGTHLSVPIKFSDGRVYGTFCCFARDVRPGLEARDVKAVRMMADLVGGYLEDLDATQAALNRRRERIQGIISDPEGLSIVFQPLVDITTEQIVAVEALARFPGSDQGPAWFFAEAAEVGLGIELELKAIGVALSLFHEIPDHIRLNVNVSPDALVTPSFFEMISGIPPERLMVEVTEHAAVRHAGYRLS